MRLGILVAFTSGVSLWTLIEYVLHRLGGHEGLFGRAVLREHLSHHARPDTFGAPAKKVALAVPVLSLIAVAVALPLGTSAGLGVASGTCAAWLTYELLHWRIHVRAPFNRYGQWARRHHLHHHFGSPKANHGVTTPLWDWAFGTLERTEEVVVPKRHLGAFPWVAQGFPGFRIG